MQSRRQRPIRDAFLSLKKRRACIKLQRLWFATSPRSATLFVRSRFLPPPFRTPHRRPTMRSSFHPPRRRPNPPIRRSWDRRPRPTNRPQNAPVFPPAAKRSSSRWTATGRHPEKKKRQSTNKKSPGRTGKTDATKTNRTAVMTSVLHRWSRD